MQILDYQISKHGTNHIEVANLSDLIGELLILSYRLEDEEIYLSGPAVEVFTGIWKTKK